MRPAGRVFETPGLGPIGYIACIFFLFQFLDFQGVPTKMKGPTTEKMRKKGLTKVKMKGINPQKNFCSANIKKLPRAYENLNPALLIAV
jgi:hypothetical protein